MPEFDNLNGPEITKKVKKAGKALGLDRMHGEMIQVLTNKTSKG